MCIDDLCGTDVYCCKYSLVNLDTPNWLRVLCYFIKIVTHYRVFNDRQSNTMKLQINYVIDSNVREYGQSASNLFGSAIYFAAK